MLFLFLRQHLSHCLLLEITCRESLWGVNLISSNPGSYWGVLAVTAVLTLALLYFAQKSFTA